MAIVYGKPNYDSKLTFEKIKFYKLSEKTPALTLRIGPPIKDLAEKGQWKVYLQQHFGYGIKQAKPDGTSYIQFKTFHCNEKKDRNRNITQECPECNEIALHKAKKDKEEARLKTEGKTEEDIKNILKFQNEWLRSHNRDSKWHFYAKDVNGEWGVCQINHSCMKLLDARIQEAVAQGVDPLAPQTGYWFKFTRTDKQGKNDSVDIDTESAGSGVFRYKIDGLTSVDEAQLEKIMPLTALGQRLTTDQIRRLVESAGDEDVVKSVFNTPTLRSESSASSQKEASPSVAVPATKPIEQPVKPVEQQSALPAQPLATPPISSVAATEEEDDEVKLMAQLEAARAKKAAKAQMAMSPQPPSVSQPSNTANAVEKFCALFETN